MISLSRFSIKTLKNGNLLTFSKNKKISLHSNSLPCSGIDDRSQEFERHCRYTTTFILIFFHPFYKTKKKKKPHTSNTMKARHIFQFLQYPLATSPLSRLRVYLLVQVWDSVQARTENVKRLKLRSISSHSPLFLHQSKTLNTYTIKCKKKKSDLEAKRSIRYLNKVSVVFLSF